MQCRIQIYVFVMIVKNEDDNDSTNVIMRMSVCMKKMMNLLEFFTIMNLY